jgi:hypothetical protein
MSETLDFSKPVCQRDGTPVRILCTDGGGTHPVIGLVRGVVQRWPISGDYGVGTGECDLLNVPETFRRERWVNVYLDIDHYFWTKEEAKKNTYSGILARVKVLVEGKAGDGLQGEGPEGTL